MFEPHLYRHAIKIHNIPKIVVVWFRLYNHPIHFVDKFPIQLKEAERKGIRKKRDEK